MRLIALVNFIQQFTSAELSPYIEKHYAMKKISPQEAQNLLQQGAVIVDIRSPSEFARQHIPGAQSLPVDQLKQGAAVAQDKVVIFTCGSGMRTQTNQTSLGTASQACTEAYILEGGISAWEKAGLELRKDASQPIEIMRQVQIAAGSLILIGVLLGFYVSPNFFWLSGFVGAGLLFAGISGTCAMARMLAIMPWNNRPTSS